MIGWLFSGALKYVMVGIVVTAIVAGAIAWHKMNFVPRVQLQQYQEYVTNITRAYAKRQRLVDEYSIRMAKDAAYIAEMEKERERLFELDITDGKCLTDDDVKRLRDFKAGHYTPEAN